MDLAVLFEPITEPDFPPGFYYAYLPSLGLTTHGAGVDGARAAAVELVRLWLEEKRAAGEAIPSPSEVLLSTLHISDDPLQGE
jgi:predicted RNase H-like HicB family nuclease